ncbi:hypothetical protein HYT17_01140 [Candidatus Microgenomates bacterium]|nr:hypothetical protein [Candidatus Microgenomates bacterium]
MSTQSKRNKRIRITAVIILLVVAAFGIYFFVNNQQVKFEKNDNKTPLSTSDETTKVVGCTRTTRLENKPVYDRALSLINEKYTTWEQGGKSNFGTWYFFPSQLVNCIKVVDGNVRNTTEAEGYFVFNDTAIKDNYFPITVDKDYSEADDIINALLLVHEMTHVRQYLDSLNNEDQLSCIDKEVEAFDAAYNFYRWQFGETEKTLNLRMQYDEDLHPQLQTLKSIIEGFPRIITPLTELCKGESAGDTCSDRITANRRQKIKDVISQDEFYIEQCKL